MEKLLRDLDPRILFHAIGADLLRFRYDEFEFKNFIVEAFLFGIFFLFSFFKLMDIDVNKVSQEFVESITLSLK